MTEPQPQQKHVKHDHIPTLSLGDLFAEALKPVERNFVGNEKLGMIYDVTRIFLLTRKLGTERLVSEEQFKENVKLEESNFWELFQKVVGVDGTEAEREAFWNHNVFWVTLACSKIHKSVQADESQGGAVERSWGAEYVGGGPLQALVDHIDNQMTKGKLYARYCSIIQSSGMGKSRLLDELSKKHFLIPINLRPRDSQGFPPADHQVRDFLTSNITYSKTDIAGTSFIRSSRFLEALFRHTMKTISDLDVPEEDHTRTDDRASGRVNLIQKFREFMSEGQTMSSPGKQRREFYDDVVRLASKDNETGVDLIGAFEELRDRVKNKRPSHPHSSTPKTNVTFPDVFVMFDEAHPLTQPFSDGKGSHFVSLRRALRVLSEQSFFTFFLSTTCKICQFTPPRGRDASHHINDSRLITPLPFIYLGFDQLMAGRKIFVEYKTLKDVTSLDCIHMGRPLWGATYDHGDGEVRHRLIHFAILKLLCGEFESKLEKAQNLAVLSQRLPLDMNSTIFVSLPDNLVEREQEQISSHMRVCMAITDGIETIRGIAASEPILSEAAAIVMNDGCNFNLADALADALTECDINAGDRAELLVSAFFTWARDRTVSAKLVPQFLGQLSRYFTVKELFASLFSESTFASMSQATPSLCASKASQRTFGEVFDGAWMHFNHFVKPHEQKVLSRPYLLAFMARGAAAFGANCQPGFDAVYPFLYGTTTLEVEQVGLIIVQVKKNDIGLERQAEIFKKMDPFACGLLNFDLIKESFSILVIRIVFALCSSVSTVNNKIYSSPSEGASYLDKNGFPRFTSYDYWCSGIDPDILRPVEQSPDKWRALVNKAESWSTFYSSALNPDVLRSQNPGGGSDLGHFTSWSGPIPNFEHLY